MSDELPKGFYADLADTPQEADMMHAQAQLAAAKAAGIRNASR